MENGDLSGNPARNCSALLVTYCQRAATKGQSAAEKIAVGWGELIKFADDDAEIDSLGNFSAGSPENLTFVQRESPCCGQPSWH
jgi:hypothetical protein